MPDSSDDTLAAQSVSHQFQSTWWCLRDVSLAIRPGELVGIAGANGVGKSTLLKILAGQLVPTNGQVLLGDKGFKQFGRREFARRVAWLPQVIPAAFEFTVREVVAQGRYPHGGALGVLSAQDLAVIDRVMAWTHTTAFAGRSVQSLSGGERQRVFLASVLAQEAPFLLLDEPTSALDLQYQVDIFARLAELAAESMGVVLVTHDLNLAGQFCTRIVLLHEGRVIADGPPADVLREDLLKLAFAADLIVARNPITGTPLIVPVGRAINSIA